MVFDRFDVERNRKQYVEAFAHKSIAASITGTSKEGASVVDIFRNGGVLASTERRRIMGARKNVGMSEASDMTSGGAKSTFVRLYSKGGGGHQIVWDDPLTLLRRSDWYAAPSDTFGSENSQSGHSASHRTADLMKVAGFSGNNEIMFRDGLDLLGADAPSKVVCQNTTQRDAVLAILKKQGIKELGGKSIDKVIVTHS
jgi:rhodanese-related sulfurtransferase